MSANRTTEAATKSQSTPDAVESFGRSLDERVKRGTGLSLAHWLTIGSIGASIALFISGRKDLAIFIGLWPPTFQALKAASENMQAGE
ncbi:MAG TPA: hypothetical protein VNO70_12975 [Blastocatellia bacterium]|nr:hypothetical protein [Blastocatellia bacterium]